MDFDALHHKECYVEFANKKEDKRAVKPQNNPSCNPSKIKLHENQGSIIIKKDLDTINPPSYIEEDKIPGNSIMEVISNISQKDYLDETIYDSYRCGTSSLVNAYLLLGGDFKKLSTKFNTTEEITYKNIHIIQDNLYRDVKISDKVGLVSSYIYRYTNSGVITQANSTGEINNAANEIGLKLTPIIGKTIKDINNKKEAVNSFFNNKKGALQVSVYLNPATGKITNNFNGLQNHYVMVFKDSDNYYLADTGQIYNGKGTNIKELNEKEVNDLVFNSPALISGITLQDMIDRSNDIAKK